MTKLLVSPLHRSPVPLSAAARKPRGTDLPATARKGLWIEIAHDHESLAAHRSAWDELAANALLPNAFYEPYMLLNAIRAFPSDNQLVFVLIYEQDPKGPPGKGRLCALFPLERARRFKGLPIAVLRLWEYANCFLCNPLLRRGRAEEALAAFLDWLAQDPRSAPVMEFRHIWGEGPIHQMLIDLFRKRGTITFQAEQATRAFFLRRAGTDDYLHAALSADKRRDLNRKQRRLEEQGKLEYRVLTERGELDQWLDDFLRLEASGWKGQGGTAMANKPDHLAYFRPMAREAFDRGTLQLIGMNLSGKPIAMRCNFLAGEGSFFFKPAYDEEYSRFSPGVLLERENIRLLHEHPRVQWMDSCTSPDNSLLNSIWLERRVFQTIQVATNRGWGRLLLSLLPLARWLNRACGRYQCQE